MFTLVYYTLQLCNRKNESIKGPLSKFDNVRNYQGRKNYDFLLSWLRSKTTKVYFNDSCEHISKNTLLFKYKETLFTILHIKDSLYH